MQTTHTHEHMASRMRQDRPASRLKELDRSQNPHCAAQVRPHVLTQTVAAAQRWHHSNKNNHNKHSKRPQIHESTATHKEHPWISPNP
jgi:hypothetical protein